jgi:hypothetical protein
VAKRSSRRARSRKRRSAGPAPRQPAQEAPGASGSGVQTEDPPAGSAAGAREPAGARQRGKRAQKERNGAAPPKRGFRDPGSVGERPQAPWHPLPLSEALILVGAIGTIVGIRIGVSQGGAAPLFVGLGAVVLGTVEVTLREHLSGYRSHTIILALLPLMVLDTILAFAVAAFVNPVPTAAKVALLVLNVPAFVFLYKLLRARFQDARRERVFAAGR